VTWVHVCPQPEIVVAMAAIVQIEADERERLPVREVDLEVVRNQIQRTAADFPHLQGEMNDAAVVAHEMIARPRRGSAGELLRAAGDGEDVATTTAAARRQAQQLRHVVRGVDEHLLAHRLVQRSPEQLEQLIGGGGQQRRQLLATKLQRPHCHGQLVL
jgi:hypothetical protein